jgi:hypothetical protein
MYILFDHDIHEIACTNFARYSYSQGQVILDKENYDLCHDIISRCPFPYSLRFRLDNNHRDTMYYNCTVDGFAPRNGLVFTIPTTESYDLVSIVEVACRSMHENSIRT